ncbi:MAG: (d)CMP kinase [Acholeplasmataceae bacterium]|jgi:cytidylate kinase
MIDIGGTMQPFHIAIDGPAGSGKSSISKELAEKLNCIHIDTGAMYRAVTAIALRNQKPLDDVNSYQFLESSKFVYKKESIYVNQENLTDIIRDKSISQYVSLVSSIQYVRKILVRVQQEIAQNNDVVMDGRDIGSVVLPYAQVKIFLTAQIEERAKRRIHELGVDIPLKQMIEDIETRDLKDSTRAISPLTKASDAVIIDTTYLTKKEVIELIMSEINKRKQLHAKY